MARAGRYRVPGADRDVGQPEALEGAERGTRNEWPRVVGRDDALAGGDPRGGVAARRPGHPVVEVAGRERDIARRSGRAARRVDAGDLRQVAARWAPKGFSGVTVARSSSFSVSGRSAMSSSRSLTCVPVRGRTASARGGRRAGCGSSRRQRSYSTASSAARQVEADRVNSLLGQVRKQACRAGEDRDSLDGGRREAEVEHRGNRHRDVHRQRGEVVL